MSRIAVFNFVGAPPSQGGQSDYIPPGRYTARIVEMKDDKSKGGERMVTNKVVIAEGEQAGATLIDYFAKMDERGSVGLKRIHACFLALSLPVTEKDNLRIDLEKQTGKLVEVDVRDQLMPANEEYGEKLTSRIVAYYKQGEAPEVATPAAEASTNGTAAKASTKTKPAPAPVLAAAAEEQEEDADEVFG